MAATMTNGRITATSGVQVYGAMTPPGTASASTIPDNVRAFAQTWGNVYQYGTTSGKIDTIVCQERTLAAGASESLNLFDGSMLDIFDKDGAISNIKFIQIVQIDNPTGTNASSITVGNAAATIQQLWFSASTGTYTITGTAAVPFCQGDNTGKTVDNTAKLVKILNNDGSNAATYRITYGGVHV